jgi:hypothetical protein
VGREARNADEWSGHGTSRCTVLVLLTTAVVVGRHGLSRRGDVEMVVVTKFGPVDADYQYMTKEHKFHFLVKRGTRQENVQFVACIDREGY